jgi:hypothetical protein
MAAALQPQRLHPLQRSTESDAMTETRSADAAWAWGCALLAAAVSIAVNIGHARPVSWGFVSFSATLPLMIVGAAELMVRRLLPAWIVAMIGVSAYALSFWHTVLLLLSWGEPAGLAVAGSVAVDGLMVGATVALYRLRRVTLAPAAADPEVRTATEVTFRRGQVTTPVTSAVTPDRDPEVRVKALGRSGVSSPDPGPRPESSEVVAALQAVWTPGQPLTREIRVGVMTSTRVSESTVKRVARTLQFQTEETR